MAKNQTDKLVWIVETIYKARKITFKELNEKWLDAVEMSGVVDMLRRTFQKWKDKICETFGIVIDCEKCAPYFYYIANEVVMKDGSVESWLLNTYSVCNSLAESKAIKDRIFCLDRMSDFRPSHHTFTYPSDFSPKDFFEGSFGIINDQDCAVQTVRLKVDAQQSNYLRDLPLHESQREVERTEAYSIFTVCVRPTFDFQQELLWDCEKLEVLEPEWLRKEIAGIVKRMDDLYSEH